MKGQAQSASLVLEGLGAYGMNDQRVVEKLFSLELNLMILH